MFGMMPFTRREDNVFDVFDRLFSHSPMDLPAFRTDIRDEDNAYLLEAELPGYQKEDISLDLKEGILTIRAEHKEETGDQDKKGNYIRKERRYSSVVRSFDVSGIAEDAIDASYENGILKIRLPKAQPALPESRRIAIQ